MTLGWVHMGQEPYTLPPGRSETYTKPHVASYLLPRRGEPEDAMGKWFPVFVFQEWCSLYSASLVQSPQEQDPKLQEANNMREEHFPTESFLLGGEQIWRSKTLVMFQLKKLLYYVYTIEILNYSKVFMELQLISSAPLHYF